MAESEKLRLFVAVGVPDDRLVALERATRKLRESLGGARWAPRPNQHVTLKFLGWTTSDQLSSVSEALRSAAGTIRPSEVQIGDLGAFPSARRARVLWAGLDDSEAVLTRLAEAVEAALEPLGFEREQRTFSPHLTLARFKVPQRLTEYPLEVEKALMQPFEVERVLLYRSRLNPKGAQYEVLEEIELGGSV